MDIIRTPEVDYYYLDDDGTYPNNANYPLTAYFGVFTFPEPDEIARVFSGNQWGGIWYNGIYSFHHYHSKAHEVLGIASGHGRVQFGGEDGVVLEVKAGDVVVVPAGVAHKKLWSETGFLVVGGYPVGQYPDMKYGKPDERPEADNNIGLVPTPIADPVYSLQGPLMKRWRTPRG